MLVQIAHMLVPDKFKLLHLEKIYFILEQQPIFASEALHFSNSFLQRIPAIFWAFSCSLSNRFWQDLRRIQTFFLYTKLIEELHYVNLPIPASEHHSLLFFLCACFTCCFHLLHSVVFLICSRRLKKRQSFGLGKSSYWLVQISIDLKV